MADFGPLFRCWGIRLSNLLADNTRKVKRIKVEEVMD